MFDTLAYFSTVCYRDFASYAGQQLQELGLRGGELFPVIYVGKHPGCTQAQLTADLELDWGYAHRTVTHLVETGFLLREKRGRSYHLELSPQGCQAFSVSHQVFGDWDGLVLDTLDQEERSQLLTLLQKVKRRIKERENPLCMNPSAPLSTTAD